MKTPRLNPRLKTALRGLEILEDRIAPATLIGLDNSNHLVVFDSATPGTTTSISVTGLGAGETLIGMDFRPATGGLYGLTADAAGAGKLYLINPTTGAATFSAALTADPADLTSPYTSLSGTNFGTDFNPVPDRLRVVSDTNQNLRINVDTGLVTTDTDINPTGSALAGAAYANSFAGAAATTLYDIDIISDKLFTQNPPNNGVLVTQGSLGVDATGVGGFDILSTRSAAGVVTNTGFAALTVGGATALYGIDLTSGAATSAGTIGDGTVALRGLTTVIGVPSATAYTVNATNNHLLSFNTATPSVTTDIGAITGIGGGESIIGFDFRPADGSLYLVTKDGANAGRIYKVSTANGAATSLFTLSADPTDLTSPYTALSGSDFGVDFNPLANRLRVVSDGGQSLRINVDTGLVITDTDLNGGSSKATGAAYANNFAGTTTTTLFDIDSVSDKLFIQNPPNNGTLVEVGSLGVDATSVNGFDIRTNGEAYATLTVGGVASLYSINLSTGAATAVGAVGAGTFDTLGLAVAPSGSLQFNSATASVAENGSSITLTIDRIGGADGTVSVLVSTADGTATAGSDYTALSKVVTFASGVTSQTVTIPITDDIRIEGSETFSVTLGSVTGAAQLGTVKTATVTITDNEPTPANASLIGLDGSNNLLFFSTSNTSTITATTAVTGLGAGESLVGIDFRPATGLLYGLTKDGAGAGKLYVINTTTGAATLSATLAADPADLTSPYTGLSGANFGTDFNPFADRLRVISDTNQNLRINVDTGLVTTDLDINPNGATLSGAAYTNSFAGAASTTLYDLDVATDQLYIQNPPNNGALSSPVPIGVDATGVGGFDIVSTRTAGGVITNTAYATLTVGGVTGVYNIDLTTGAASLFGSVGDGSVVLRGLTSATGTPSAKAFTVDGSNNHLLSFNTATPSVSTDVGAITGLGVGESIIGFDFRPADGQLYLVTKDGSNAGRIYTVNTSTAVASGLFVLTPDPTDTTNAYTALNGSNFGVDFNPFANRLRIVSDAGQNLRMNVDTGFVITDTDLNGGATSATGAAYSNNFAGTTTTTLFDIDTASDKLFIQNPPNNGTLVEVGSLGVDATAINGFDIRTNGEAYASLTVGGLPGLYRIDLGTGAATLVGTVGSSVGLALVPSGAVQFNATTATIAEGGGSVSLTIDRIGGTDGVVSVLVNTSNGTASAGSDFTGVSKVVTFASGISSQTINIPITQDIRIEGNETFTVTLSDAAGGAALGANKTATITITDDEPTPATASLVGLDGSNNLLFFSSANTASITATVAVTGLGSGESLIGIDYRPATGALYGVTKDGSGAGKVYTINTTTGAATLSASLTADPADTTSPYSGLTGNNFGTDFNPVPDRLRLVSDSGQNLRINVDTGLVTTDTDLNPGGTSIGGVAYANAFAGTATTTLYDLDVTGDNLLVQNPPNNGVLVTQGSLGIDATGVGGFDIVSKRSADGTTVTNTAYAALTVGGVSGLYNIDLTSGAATLFGTVGDGSVALRGLTSAITPSATAYTIRASDSHLVSFNTATPSTTTDLGAVTGLGSGESIIGFDFRPANGSLYVVTKDGSNAARLYTLNTATGAATAVGSALVADAADTSSPFTALNGTNFGVDFNPVADRLRIVSDAGQNLRINVDTGLVTTDADLNGPASAATGAAYTNSFFGTASTVLYDIDPTTDTLYIQTPPNNGVLTTPLSLGVDATSVNGFDIRANGEAFASLTVGGVASLYKIDLTTGAATAVGALGDGASDSLGLAIASNGSFQISSTTYSVAEDGTKATITVNRVGGSEGTATVLFNTVDGTATAGSDYTAVSKVLTFAPGVTSLTVDVPVNNDLVAEGNEAFSVALSNVNGASLHSVSTSTVTITDNDTGNITIADVSTSEGNSGTKVLTFTVTLSSPAQSDFTLNYATASATALAGEDFVAASGSIVFTAGQTTKTIDVTINGDTTQEQAETFTLSLQAAPTLPGNVVLLDGIATGTILNDDAAIAANGKTATFTDPSGNLVTIKTTAGTLSSANVVLVPFGAGAVLASIDLTTGGFANANITITAKRSALGGDGFVNVGYLNATGVALGTVAIDGDLGQIDAGAVKSLTAQSLGKLGLNTQAPGGSLISNLTGSLGKLTVATDVAGAALVVTGNIGPVKIGGNLTGVSASAPGSITATGDIGAVTIGGSIVGGTTAYTGGIEAGGKLASLTVGGSIKGGTGTASGSVIAKTSGAIKVKGDLDLASIFVAGNVLPTAKLATALAGLSVTGSVSKSNILVGYDRTGSAINADVAVGAVSVTGDWTASNLVAGIASNDGIYGNDGDTLIGGGNTVVAKIASIAVKGQVTGTFDINTDGFGFVAEQIGSFKVGKTPFPLTKGTDSFAVGASGDVRVREFTV